MSLINSTAIPSGAGYEIDQSLRFNDDDSAYLSRTPASASNRKTFTFSAWVKRGTIGVEQHIFDGSTGGDSFYIRFNSNNTLQIRDHAESGLYFKPTALFRDCSAWYNFVLAVDTTQGTEANRVKFYVNGEQVTSWSEDTYPSQNDDTGVNGTTEHRIGRDVSAGKFDGYLGEVNFIDGAQKAPADFGETGDYGEWKPIAYLGSYGTNGFYLPFKQDYTVEGFSTVTWQGNSASSAYIGGAGFQPDLTWIKSRSIAASHNLVDSIRGANKRLRSDSSGAENNQSENGYVGSFDNDGFTLIQGSSTHNTYTGWFETNQSGVTYVAWNWDMGSSNASNTNGSITSTVRANSAYGQSIVSYTGNASAGATIGHGLSSQPEMIIVKKRAGGSAYSWGVWHTGLSNNNGSKQLLLNDDGGEISEDMFNEAIFPSNSATVFATGENNHTNFPSNATYIAYCFHSVSGYSSFGSYSGTNGTHTITTGFAPAFLLIKNRTNDSSWSIWDNTRNPNNPVTQMLRANVSNAEETKTDREPSFLSTGFSIGDSDVDTNENGSTYIYMAFADTREYAYWLDQSGNNNDWTSNGLTESDISVDSPTNNFCTLNPLDSNANNNIVVSEANLRFTNSGSAWDNIGGTFAFKTGKWYWEMLPISGSLDEIFTGIKDTAAKTISTNAWVSGSILWYNHTGGELRVNGTDTTANYGDLAIGDILGVAVNMDDRQITFYKNNSALVSNYAIPSEILEAMPHALTDANTLTAYNFGQDSSFAGAKTAQGNLDGNNIGDFFYEPPNGFLSLCSQNLTTPTVIPNEHFAVVPYNGNGAATGSITDDVKNFPPDLVWIKQRSQAGSHILGSRLIGDGKYLSTDSDAIEVSDVEKFRAFTGNGFQIGTHDDVSEAGQTYVAWNWKAGGSGASNTNGSINTTKTSANVDAGFSMMTYTGTNSVRTIGHGLSKAPEMWAVKARTNVSDNQWFVCHKGFASDYYTDFIHFDNNAPKQDSGARWGDTAPTASVITIGTASTNVSGGDYVCYAWHSVDGYSKVGSYTGNGNADGTFVYTGFRPAWVMIKTTAITESWYVWDTGRSTFNLMDDILNPDSTNAESVNADRSIDVLSNGFKLRGTNSATNGSDDAYIFLAFAETPFSHSNAR